MKPLLVLVDLQQDYLKSPELDPAAGSVVDGAAALLAHARAESVPVAHVWTTVTRDPDNRMAHWKREGLWQCEAGTEGHAPPAALAPRAGEPIMHKSAFSTPDVAGFIERLGRDTVIIAGVKTHACVRQFALDAWQAGYGVIIAADAVGSDDPLHEAATRRYFKARGIEFLSNAELKHRLAPGLEQARARRIALPRGRRRWPPLPRRQMRGASAARTSGPSCCAASPRFSSTRSSPSPR